MTLVHLKRKTHKKWVIFFCKVHPLITFAEESNKALLWFESAVMEGKSKYALPSSGESGTVRLIRTACQAFQKRGNQQAGQLEDFKPYLGELDYPLKLITMEGQRFNVIFYNGGAVYYHREHVSNFINSKCKNNRLLLAVNEDLSNKVFVAGVRSLGIIPKLITGPYLRLVGKLEHMLDLNPYLLQLQQSFLKMQCLHLMVNQHLMKMMLKLIKMLFILNCYKMRMMNFKF